MSKRAEMRSLRSIGVAARRRIAAGRPSAIGRQAATVRKWTAIRDLVLSRARWACQAYVSRTHLDVHHVLNLNLSFESSSSSRRRGWQARAGHLHLPGVLAGRVRLG